MGGPQRTRRLGGRLVVPPTRKNSPPPKTRQRPGDRRVQSGHDPAYAGPKIRWFRRPPEKTLPPEHFCWQDEKVCDFHRPLAPGRFLRRRKITRAQHVETPTKIICCRRITDSSHGGVEFWAAVVIWGWCYMRPPGSAPFSLCVPSGVI